ncbi:hypothetical protein [Pedobacter cryoconitis]|nr:hypothetical protein [Pedobacter cryoconitis]
MKKIILFCGLLMLISFNAHTQQFTKQFNFVLQIDDEIPEMDIHDGFFIVKDSTGKFIKDQIPFEYHVGRLMLPSEGYNKLYTMLSKHRIFIRFKLRELHPQAFDVQYEGEIPFYFLNEEYLICRIYNIKSKENRLKYNFRGKKYLFNLIMPGTAMILLTWPESTKEEIRLNQH